MMIVPYNMGFLWKHLKLCTRAIIFLILESTFLLVLGLFRTAIYVTSIDSYIIHEPLCGYFCEDCSIICKTLSVLILVSKYTPNYWSSVLRISKRSYLLLLSSMVISVFWLSKSWFFLKCNNYPCPYSYGSHWSYLFDMLVVEVEFFSRVFKFIKFEHNLVVVIRTGWARFWCPFFKCANIFSVIWIAV